ncbi:MAG: DUF4145 domain-containing protein [Candidatus Gastranaerophilales bacterium]|nr:DUF4145 domain-containing protein [Candidatus Gastranaerophilales bacterium]
MSNFVFLKKNNEKFFKIILEAEKLFRDEYYEQSVVQTRRFAENICKDLLQDKITPEDTFDSMINKIKDNSNLNIRMKEFTDDLYFLKKYGNISAHSSSSSIKPEIALECLERSYEIAIFYSHMKYGINKKLEKTLFSEEILMTGEKPFQKKYVEKLKKEKKKSVNIKPKKRTSAKITKKKKAKIKISRFEFEKLKPAIMPLFVLMLLGCLFVYFSIQKWVVSAIDVLKELYSFLSGIIN